MTINPFDPAPAYLQIADALRRKIVEGDLPDGAVLPSVRKLVDEFGTAQGTVRQAIEQLKSEGLVVARQAVAYSSARRDDCDAWAPPDICGLGDQSLLRRWKLKRPGRASSAPPS
ncbi:MAG: GntR family transcriptional regulator [Pseudonocardiaceae bacterium]